MGQTLANRFDRIVNDNLPKRKEMMEVLRDNALEAQIFSKNGEGLKSILSHTGRITDFKGVYAFAQQGKFVYIDESSYVIKRLIRHFKGNSKYQQKLANIMINYNKPSKPEYSLNDALAEMKKMTVVFLDLPDDLERQITVLYLQCQYECTYNRFD